VRREAHGSPTGTLEIIGGCGSEFESVMLVDNLSLHYV